MEDNNDKDDWDIRGLFERPITDRHRYFLFNGIISQLREMQQKYKLTVGPNQLGLLNGSQGVKSFPLYAQLGSLFAQNLITGANGVNLSVKGMEMDSVRKLSKFVEHVNNLDFITYPYIQQTLSCKPSSKKAGNKSFYTSEPLIKNTLLFCKLNNIPLSPEYIRKVKEQTKNDNIFNEL